MSDLHPTATEGYGHGAETYARGRPDFPSQSLDWLKDDLHLGPGKRALEIGAGTGKFTKLLVKTGADIVAIEPVVAMLEQLNASQPHVRTLCATAQNLPLSDATMDAVICAQAFHWFATANALAEMRRVLKPGGMLGLIWNVRDQSVGWLAELTRIMEPYEDNAPRYDGGEWKRSFPARGFDELRERRFLHQHMGSPEQVIVDRVASVSFIAALDEGRREKVLAEVRALIAATPELANKAEIAVPYVTNAYWAVAR